MLQSRVDNIIMYSIGVAHNHGFCVSYYILLITTLGQAEEDSSGVANNR